MSMFEKVNTGPNTEVEVSSVARKHVLLDVMVHLLRRAHFRCESLFPGVFAEYDLTSRQLALLVAIGQRPNSSQKTIGESVARLCCANRLMAEAPLSPDRLIPRLP